MKKTMKKMLSVILSLIMVFSCFAGIITTVQAVGNLPIAGDINGDGTVNNKDLTRLMKYIAGEDVEVVTVTVDTNGDGSVNNKDLTRLMGHLAGDETKPLAPIVTGCTHEREEIAAVEATCTAEGNIAYWYCAECDKYFSDADGAIEITLDETVIAKLPHTEEVIPGYPATMTQTGLTDGLKCNVCNAILVKQEIIPISEYEIEYIIGSNDTYLTKLLNDGKIENPNPKTYSTEKGTDRLEELVVPGYTFEGWYDASGASGVLVRKIEPGETGKQRLYAKWTKEVYTISFDSPEVPWDDVTYTVDTGKTLTNPSWFGYTFVGWSENGKIVKSIPVGTVGNKTLHANWTSDRNKAVSKPLTKPEIIEDLENNRYMFVYEIGEIENVPLNLIEDYGKSESLLELNKQYEYSQTVDESFIETAATAVSDATTKTSSWTLSEDWNTSTSATNEHEEEIGKTKGQVDSQGTVTGSQYYISNSSGGSTSSSSSAGGSNSTSSKVTTDTSTGISNDYSRKSELDTSVDLNVEASVGAGWGPVSAEVKAGASSNVSTHDEEAFNCASYRDTYVGTYDESNNNSYWDTSSTASASWNTTNSYQSSSSVSTNKEISSSISEAVFDRWGYSSTEDRGGGSSETNSTDETKTSTEEYVSTIERSTEERKTLTTEINKTFTTPGYYRLVTAGRLHVFAVVGYDVASKSYFTYTYSVLDKERYSYIDYSKSQSDYDDCENAILPFEVPYDVHEYISDVTARSNGLQISSEGIVTGYSGTAEYVVIPEYTTGGDNTSADEAIRVRGIASDAFAGNTTIKAVSLPKYVTEIPDNAFSGCTALQSVFGYSINSIGDEAFSGCINLKKFTVDKYFTYIGEEAFKDVPEISAVVNPSAIYEMNKAESLDEAKTKAEDVARSLIYSGAKRISIDVSSLGSAFDGEKIVVDSSTEFFAIINNAVNTYNNLKIESNATETYLSGMIFINNTDTPLKLNSQKVTLNKVTVENAPGFALILPNETTQLYVYDIIELTSLSDNAVISQNVNVSMADTGTTSKLQLTGNYLVCGNLDDNSLLSFTNGEVVLINEEQFESYLTSSIITFDPNGGELSDEATKVVYYGQLYGELPVPAREHYSFIGWFTEKENGTEVIADSVVEALVNQTLYAHWVPNSFTLTYNANGGTVSTLSKELTFGDSYGTLPIPTRDYYTFIGWFTEATGGAEVSETTTQVNDNNVTIYAHWEQKPVSGWVKASEMPSGAQLVSQEWRYTLREYTEKSASSLSGWTKYDTKRTSWGAWSNWSTTNPSNGVRNVEHRSVYDHTEYHYYRWTNSNHSAMYTYKTSSYNCTILEEKWFNYELPASSKGSPIKYDGTDNWANRWAPANYAGNYDVDKTFTRSVNRTEWRYQEPVYTYYYYRDVSKTATSDPTGQANVSNVVKWVQYREK